MHNHGGIFENRAVVVRPIRDNFREGGGRAHIIASATVRQNPGYATAYSASS